MEQVKTQEGWYKPMRICIDHRTDYVYDEPVSHALQQLRLTPKSRAGQEVVRWAITIDGGRVELEFDDQHNNRVTPGQHRARQGPDQHPLRG